MRVLWSSHKLNAADGHLRQLRLRFSDFQRTGSDLPHLLCLESLQGVGPVLSAHLQDDDMASCARCERSLHEWRRVNGGLTSAGTYAELFLVISVENSLHAAPPSVVNIVDALLLLQLGLVRHAVQRVHHDYYMRSSKFDG